MFTSLINAANQFHLQGGDYIYIYTIVPKEHFSIEGDTLKTFLYDMNKLIRTLILTV